MRHRHLLSDLITSGTFGNQPIAVKLGAVSDQAKRLNVLLSRGSPLSGK
jgi:hypothetical protein